MFHPTIPTASRSARALAVLLPLLLCAACGGAQAPSDSPPPGALGADPDDPLSFLPDTTVGVLRLNPEALRAHQEEHGALWAAARCIGMDPFRCTYSGYFGREWPLLGNNNGDRAVRLLRALMRRAFELDAGDPGAAEGLAPQVDEHWLVAVVLPADVQHAFALWLPSPDPLPAGSCRANTSWVRMVLPMPYGEPARRAVLDSCTAALDPDTCEHRVQMLPAGERVIVDVGRTEGCHEQAPVSLATALRGSAARGLLDDPANVFAVHLRPDLLDDLHRAFAWDEYARWWEHLESIPPEYRLQEFMGMTTQFPLLSDPRLLEPLFHAVTLRLRQGGPGLALDLVGEPTTAGLAVLDALTSSGGADAPALAREHNLADLSIVANLSHAISAMQRIQDERDVPLTFRPGDWADPLLHYPDSEAMRSAPWRSVHRLRFLAGGTLELQDHVFEEIRSQAEGAGVDLTAPDGWEGILPSSLALAVEPAEDDGHTPWLHVVTGIAHPTPFADLFAAMLREQVEAQGLPGGPEPAIIAAEEWLDPPPLDEDDAQEASAPIDAEEAARPELPPQQTVRLQTAMHAGPDAMHLVLSTADSLPESGEPTLRTAADSALLQLQLRPWLHPASSDPEHLDPYTLSPDHWSFGWLTAPHWFVALLHPEVWADPDRQVTAFLRAEGGLLVGGLHAGAVTPLGLTSQAVPAESDHVPACLRHAARWFPWATGLLQNHAPENRAIVLMEAAELLDEVAESCPPEHGDTAELIRAHGRTWAQWAQAQWAQEP